MIADRELSLAHHFADLTDPRIDRTLPLDQVGTAFDALADRAVTGKIVLALDR